MANILAIDDEELICWFLKDIIEPMGHRMQYALGLREGLKKASGEPFDLVILDVLLPDGNGLDAIPVLRSAASSPEVIIITGAGNPDAAELAIKTGAWDYFQKPFSIQDIKLAVTRVLQYRQEKTNRSSPIILKKDGIIGDSPQMKRCFGLVAKAAATNANVLITGETGTGKELFSRAIHMNSDRSHRGFVVLDCAALPETLVESMLFGHEKGAFTGADRNRQGFVEQAHKGTLFLDEVGELPVNIQSAFLRVLQERRYRPVGGKTEIASEFRLIAATNRSLDQMVKEGRFRKDLLFRLRSVEIVLPPLAKRTKDIKDLAFLYMNKFCDRYGIGTKGFSPEFLEALSFYRWPGNIRELINAMESAISEALDDPTLFPIHLPKYIRAKLARASIGHKTSKKAGQQTISSNSEPFPTIKELIEETERKYFQNLVSFAGGDIKEVCRISGLSRANTYARLKKYNISRKY